MNIPILGGPSRELGARPDGRIDHIGGVPVGLGALPFGVGPRRCEMLLGPGRRLDRARSRPQRITSVSRVATDQMAGRSPAARAPSAEATRAWPPVGRGPPGSGAWEPAAGGTLGALTATRSAPCAALS